MTRTSSRFADYIGRDNRAVPHMRAGDGWAPREQREPDAQSPAGGVSSSVADMAKWMLMVLGDGSSTARRWWRPRRCLPAISPQSVSQRRPTPPTRARASTASASASAISPAGRVELSHSGGFNLGAATVYRLIPSAGVGIVVLSNAQPIGAVEAIGLSFTDLVEFGEVTPRLAGDDHAAGGADGAPLGRLAGATPPADPAPARAPDAYAGTYANEYFGPIEIAEAEGPWCSGRTRPRESLSARPPVGRQLRLRARRRERNRRHPLGGELHDDRDRHRRSRDRRVLERRGPRHLHPLSAVNPPPRACFTCMRRAYSVHGSCIEENAVNPWSAEKMRRRDVRPRAPRPTSPTARPTRYSRPSRR